MPPFLDRGVVRKRRHRGAVDPRGERPEDVLHVIRVLAAPSEVPALVPARRLDREPPVVLQVERVSVTVSFHSMAFDALLVHHQLSALLEALLARRNRLEAVELQDREGLGVLVIELAILDELARHERNHLTALVFAQDALPRRHGRPGQSVRDGLEEVHLRKGQLSAGRVSNLEGALIEIPGPGPETVSGGAVPPSVHSMTPDTFGEIDPLPGFDVFRRRHRGHVGFLESFRDSAAPAFLGISPDRRTAGDHADSNGGDQQKQPLTF